MHAAIATEAYTCPKCGERSTKGQLSQTGFHCPRCTLELAHLDLAPNGTVRQVHGWLLGPGDLVQGRYRVTSVLGKGGFAATYLVTDERLQGKRRALKELPRDLYEADFSKALDLDPKFLDARRNRGTEFLRQKRYESAIDDFSAVLAADGDDTGTLYKRAYAYCTSGKGTLGAKDLRAILGIEPKNDDAKALLRECA